MYLLRNKIKGLYYTEQILEPSLVHREPFY
jgi:hypothetical protein